MDMASLYHCQLSDKILSGSFRVQQIDILGHSKWSFLCNFGAFVYPTELISRTVLERTSSRANE